MTKKRRTPPRPSVKSLRPVIPVARESDPITDAMAAGESTAVAVLSHAYRLWAALPDDIHGIAAFSGDQAVAAVRRPATFPPGICQGCGCSPNARCQIVLNDAVRLCAVKTGAAFCSVCLSRAVKAPKS